MSTAFAETSRATVRLLTRAGYEVSLPARQGCCGALHAHCGEREAAREFARRNIDAFEQKQDTKIVVNAAGAERCSRIMGTARDDPAYSAGCQLHIARARHLGGSGRATTASFQRRRDDRCLPGSLHLAQAQGITPSRATCCALLTDTGW